ncbi:MAG: bifunctional nuclease family protein [Thermocrinis sp.]|jgi:bifunctional DNase/RNase|uniref:bifunctional nuclease family protein n=1 Tax=Thermocrinis sp. TaxID=2024383 RepID=UPI00157EBBCC|nr:bifunctional nuclease family protein [Thermocrinis sp.]MDT7871534.1 bifunctional nuclease family protein [Thermocrinis sp.]MDT7910996.1 bifunctional nuclease family protein [Thermocrinis sp.]NAZ23570.1 bifunctional nuclease family protein [Thermocrinis sp.]
MLEMVVHGITLDPVSQMPIVVLKAKDDDETVLPIWIGIFEADSILRQLQNVEPPRPMTYELMKNVITQMGGVVDKVIINDLRDSTYYAEVHILQGNNRLIIDSRPSDAINIALRFSAPIFVEESVLEKSRVPKPEEDEEKKKLREWLENIKPEDFEKGLG